MKQSPFGAGAKAIIFDFDGTLVDASEPICRSFNEVLSGNGILPWDLDSVRRMIGRPLRDMFAAAAPGAPRGVVERLVEEYRAVFLPLSLALSRPLPGCRELIEGLVPFRRLAIATSRTGSGAWRILEALDLSGYFEVIIGIQDVVQPKPHPEPVLRALERLRVAPEHAVMVGDTVDDMVAGKAAGVFTVGITTGVHLREELAAAGADEVVEHLTEILRLAPILSGGNGKGGP